MKIKTFVTLQLWFLEIDDVTSFKHSVSVKFIPVHRKLTLTLIQDLFLPENANITLKTQDLIQHCEEPFERIAGHNSCVNSFQPMGPKIIQRSRLPPCLICILQCFYKKEINFK